jgi:putative ABC transport system substrate-binding protein
VVRRGHMRRRDFITLLGGTAASWPMAARAQQAMPVIGFLNSQSLDGFMEPLRGFRRGLKEGGFVEGENVVIEYRWAENQNERLPLLAAELVQRKVAVIAAMSTGSALAAKAATTTIPIVFVVGEDPVRSGLVSSLARPSENLTGVNFLTAELTAKRLELLRELVPDMKRVAVIIDASRNPVLAEAAIRDLDGAARNMGLQTQIIDANTAPEINAAFAGLARARPDAVFMGPGAFFNARRVHLAQLAARHALPTVYAARANVEAGGLISYGASNTDAWYQLGVHVGRILKGAKPADLPVLQSAKFELVVNVETARMLNLTVPPSLFSRADEVIE